MEIKERSQLPLLLKHFSLPPRAIEIGVAGASNTIDLLKNGIEYIYCVDNWGTLDTKGDGSFPQEWHEENYRSTIERLAQFPLKSTILRGLSSEMHVFIPNDSVGLVYIDSDHNYESVKSDIENYLPKLVKGGIIAFHDWPNYEGVVQAVEEFTESKNLEIHVIPEDCRENSGCWVRI